VVVKNIFQGDKQRVNFSFTNSKQWPCNACLETDSASSCDWPYN